MSNYSFNVMPTVNISRSRFQRNSQNKTSFNLGDIIPIYCDEVLPGDTRSIDLAALVRMSTPIAPIMDNIYLDLFAFFVPNRIVWDHWKEFMGENNVSAGIPEVEYHVPYLSQLSNEAGNVDVGSYADYFGLPVDRSTTYLARNKVSALPFRGLAKIYNRWFRNQNVIAPLAIQTGDTNEVLVGEVEDYEFSKFACDKTSILKASKLPDYFTKALPYAQKGAPVTIPLGTTAPLVADNSIGGGYTIKNFQGQAVTGGNLFYNVSLDNGSSFNGKVMTGLSSQSTLYADLTQATAATINQLRFAFQLQKLLEKDALYGSLYWQVLAAHFNVTAPDASLQDPEYLGGQRIHINIDQVLSQSGYNDDPTTDLGKPGANSVTGYKGSLFTKSFVEHGHIFILAVARHDQTYNQGINRMWTRQGRYDYYWPVFANLGAQAILKKEIYVGSDETATDDEVFGYQEAWAEYRFKPSICTGLMRPGVTGSLDYWTLANDFGSVPTLGKVFIEQDRNNLSRALSTGENGPDFIADFFFRDIAVRPMPMYSIPGLIDHH